MCLYIDSVHWLNYPCNNDWLGRPLLPEIFGQTDSVGVKSPIFDLLLLVTPQP